MDRDAAIRCLTDDWELAQRANDLPTFSRDRRGALDELNKRLPIVDSFLRGLAPDMPTVRAYRISDHFAARGVITRPGAAGRLAEDDVGRVDWS
jgi:hypothetical protein